MNKYEKYKELINRTNKFTATVVIDRPLYSFHPKFKYEYPLNYGYIDQILAPDDQFVDAYIIGENLPLKIFTGEVIAIIRRKTDVEDKLVVCDPNKYYNKEEILQLVYFQEQYFDHKILMMK
ncbi:inorganic_pyrophosphatase [Hexamita inflata]|uniref:inorganic diphosphatase n=1 Tax=Hexamita inflata TaxID=28002 RepID=A0ABP1LE66_9EUKA